MSLRPHILVIGSRGQAPPAWLGELRTHCDLETLATGDLPEADRPPADAVIALGQVSGLTQTIQQVENLLNFFPDAIAVLDGELRIRWHNPRLEQFFPHPEFRGRLFLHDVIGPHEILGPDYSPFNMAVGTGETIRTTIQIPNKTYYELMITPLATTPADFPEGLLVTVRDITLDVIQKQKLQAIYQAGLEFGDLTTEELVELPVESRIGLLKEKIIHFTKDVLEYETVEIRLLDKRSNELEPLLNVGMTEEAAHRKLYALTEGNGVTGFVAATGKGYLCDDTTTDQRYLQGAAGARSSLTVPLILHDQVLGTLNVEGSQPGTFNENDLHFLELFGHEVAIALHTLEFLAAEKLTAATTSTELILREVARPADEIINDTAWVLERYIGHDPAVCERLQRVLQQTRALKQLIQKVGETLVPESAVPIAPAVQRPQRPILKRKRVLVVDHDDAVRQAAHDLLGRFGCEVETAHHGEEALLMVRNFHYDVVIADIRLPDMTGYDCFVRIREIHGELPVILMTGFGYDPSHSIVKARQAGLKSVLYKPFRLDQLLSEVEKAVSSPAETSGGERG